MCTCNPNNNNREEYQTLLSEFESVPYDHRTSTRYYEEDFVPEFISTPRSIYDTPRTRVRSRRGRESNLTVGVAIVPRRIDFDAVSDVGNPEEDLELARETLEQLKNATQRPITESIAAPGTYRLRRARATQYPSDYRKQYVPRIVQITPCGKCLRI